MIKLVIFDLDGVLVNNTITGPVLYPNIICILDDLRNRGIKIALASHNIGSRSILDNMGILEYFDHLEYYYDNSNKVSHLLSIMVKFADINYDEILFVEDTYENIVHVRTLGIQTQYVPNRDGLISLEL